MSEDIICNTCRMIFKDQEEHRTHFKSQIHTFNLKRKVANLAPVTKEQYEKKMEQMSQKSEENSKYEAKCTACNKSFASKNAYEQHLQSKKHLKELKSKNGSKNKQQKNEGKNKEGEINNNENEIQSKENGNENKKEVEIKNNNTEGNNIEEGKEDKATIEDEDKIVQQQQQDKTPFPDIYTKLLDINSLVSLNLTTEEGEEIDEQEKKEVEEKIRNAYSFAMEECIICYHVSKSFAANVDHMTKDHGLFLPDLEYLVDLEGMIYYLGKKLAIGNACFWCDKHFHSLDAAMHHMRDKGHSKLRDMDDDDEFDEFYDFSESYGGKEYDEVVKSAQDNISVSDDGMHITFKNSNKVIAHRNIAKYHKQRLAPVEKRDSVLINRMLQSYRMLGYSSSSSSGALLKSGHSQSSLQILRAQQDNKKMQMQKKTYLSINQKWYMNLGIKCNRLQKFYKDQNNLIKYG